MAATSPSTTLYTLGKGVLSLAPWVGDAPPTPPLDDMGNCSSFEAEVTEETLEHFSSRSGVRSKDKVITLETGYTLTFILDEMSVNNLKLFLRATQSGNALRAATALDLEYAITFISDNPYGPNETWEFHKARISPNGPFNLISDEWSTMSFSAEGLKDASNNPTSPFFTVTFATTTTTTTTTT